MAVEIELILHEATDAEIDAAVTLAFQQLVAEGVIQAPDTKPTLSEMGEMISAGGVVLPEGVTLDRLA
jgi:hypothetical protein